MREQFKVANKSPGHPPPNNHNVIVASFPLSGRLGGKYYICVDILSSGWAEVMIMIAVLLSKVIS